jgi:succinate-acetate transporter protein
MMHPTVTRGHSDEEVFVKLMDEIHGLRSHMNPPVPNPAPLGLLAFGFTTALLQVKHTRIGGSSEEDLDGVETFVLGFAMFFGGFLQIVAGLSEVRRNNIFGYTAFLLFGGFWMSLGTVDIVQLLAGDATPPNPKAVQAVMFLSGAFTTILWICSFKLNKTLNLLFFLLASTLFLLCLGVRNEAIDQVGGWFGFATAAVAYWLAAAELINDIHGEGKREIIPLGHFRWNQYGGHGGMQAPGRIQPAHVVQQSQRGLFASARHLFHLSKQHQVGDIATPSADSIPEENVAIPTQVQQQQTDIEEGSGGNTK